MELQEARGTNITRNKAFNNFQEDPIDSGNAKLMIEKDGANNAIKI